MHLGAELICCHCARIVGELWWPAGAPDRARLRTRGNVAGAVRVAGGVRCAHCRGPLYLEPVSVPEAASSWPDAVEKVQPARRGQRGEPARSRRRDQQAPRRSRGRTPLRGTSAALDRAS
jgi:hypothetical protein